MKGLNFLRVVLGELWVPRGEPEVTKPLSDASGAQKWRKENLKIPNSSVGLSWTSDQPRLHGG